MSPQFRTSEVKRSGGEGGPVAEAAERPEGATRRRERSDRTSVTSVRPATGKSTLTTYNTAGLVSEKEREDAATIMRIRRSYVAAAQSGGFDVDLNEEDDE